MKIMAFSDTHGCLRCDENGYSLPIPKEKINVICICGDIVPLEYQSNSTMTMEWLVNDFFKWADYVECEKIIFIAGNHDKWFERWGKDVIKNKIMEFGLKDKLIYLCDDVYIYDNIIFYGTPWIKDLVNWAFYSPDLEKQWKNMPYSDVLLTHLPPNIDKIGCSYPYCYNERNFGSTTLTNKIMELKPLINLCGHVHTGIHGGIKYLSTTVYNVSIVNEDYIVAYEPLYITIEPRK